MRRDAERTPFAVEGKARSGKGGAQAAVVAIVAALEGECTCGQGVVAEDAPVEGVVVADRGSIEEASVEGAAIVADGVDAGGMAGVAGAPCRRVVEVCLLYTSDAADE